MIQNDCGKFRMVLTVFEKIEKVNNWLFFG